MNPSPNLPTMGEILDAVPMAIALIGPDLNYLYVNQGYCDWFRLPADRILGRTVPEIIGPSAFSAARPHVEAVLTGEQQYFESRYVEPTGMPKVIAAVLRPWFGSQGEVVAYTSMVRETTQETHTRDALLLQEASWRQLFDTMREGWVHSRAIRNERGAIVDFVMMEGNPAFEYMIGLPKEVWVGASVRDVFQTNDEGVALTARVVESGQPMAMAGPLPNTDRWAQWMVYTPRRDEVCSIVLDITDQQRQALDSEARRKAAAVEVTHARDLLSALAESADPTAQALVAEARRALSAALASLSPV